MSQDTNMFGGRNRQSLYVPMSDIEQEVLARLVESGDLHIHVLGWGVVHNPKIIFGDLRVTLTFRLTFDKPDVPIPVSGFDLELRTGSGLLLYKQWMKTEYDGKPIPCGGGIFYDMAWDIAIQHMDPRLVKALMPQAHGLTSRIIDKDTKDPSLRGNMDLSAAQQRQLYNLRSGEAAVRQDDRRQATAIIAKSKS